jgi:hypothetical protein
MPNQDRMSKNAYLPWVLARKHELVSSVLARLRVVGGEAWWHLVVEWGKGQYRATDFLGLADLIKADPRRVHTPLAVLPLPKAATIEQATLATGVDHRSARIGPDMVLVLTHNHRCSNGSTQCNRSTQSN